MDNQVIYEELNDIEGVLKTPYMYLPSLDNVDKEVVHYDNKTSKLSLKKINVNEGFVHLFIELMNNATDNVFRSYQNKVNPYRIEVYTSKDSNNNTWFSVKNYGNTISQPIIDGQLQYPLSVQKVFGTVRTSSNYNNSNIIASGRHGYGAKLTNIFSKVFTAVSINNGYKISVTWTDNMMKMHPPVVEVWNPQVDPIPYTQITYLPDYYRFSMTNEHLESNISVIHGYCINTSLNITNVPVEAVGLNNIVPVYFNNIEYKIMDLPEYITKYLGLELPAGKFFTSTGRQVKKKTTGMNKENKELYEKVKLLHFEYFVFDNLKKGDSVQLSFLNCLNLRGSPFTAVEVCIKDMISDEMKEAFDEKPTTSALNQIVKTINFVSRSYCYNPIYDHQKKDIVTQPEIIAFKPDPVVNMLQWESLKSLKDIVDEKKLNKAISEARKTSPKDIGKYTPVSNPNSKHDKILILVEGDSADGYARKFVSLFTYNTKIDNINIPLGTTGNNIFGTFPLKGKPKNLLNIDKSEDYIKYLYDNASTLSNIRTILGIKQPEGPGYKIDPKKLNYQHILIMTDADVDGTHITGLLTLDFYMFARSLVDDNRLKFLQLPVIRYVNNNKDPSKDNLFYSLQQFNNWPKPSNFSSNRVLYLKGLASNDDKYISDDIKRADKSIITLTYDQNAVDNLQKAFSDSEFYKHERKKWVYNSYFYANQIENVKIQYIEMMMRSCNSTLAVSDFINHRLIEYSMESNIRNIPVLTDGFKESQRKIIYTNLKKYNNITSIQGIKLSIATGVIITETEYNHGETSLHEASIKLVNDYTGSNNLPLLTRKSQFASRDDNGKKTSHARYLFYDTDFPWLHKIFNKDDSKYVCKQLVSEGSKVEYREFYPIIPMQFVNGVTGVGTGYSSDVYCYNPLDLILWIQSKMTTSKGIDIKPWYRNFYGTIIPTPSKDQVINEYNGVTYDTQYTCIGRFRFDSGSTEDHKTVIIDDIPIGTSIVDYTKFLEELQSQEIIASYNITPNHIIKKSENNDKPLIILYECNIKKLLGSKRIDFDFDNKHNLILDSYPGNGLEYDNYRKHAKENPAGMNNINKVLENIIKIASLFKLVRIMSTTNYTFMTYNDDGLLLPITYNNVQDALEEYYKVRLNAYKVRIDGKIEDIKKILFELSERKRFIELYFNNKIVVHKRPIEDLKNDLRNNNFTEDIIPKITSIRISNLTYEEYNKLLNDIKEREDELSFYMSNSSESIWNMELEDLRKSIMSSTILTFYPRYGKPYGYNQEVLYKSPWDWYTMNYAYLNST